MGIFEEFFGRGPSDEGGANAPQILFPWNMNAARPAPAPAPAPRPAAAPNQGINMAPQVLRARDTVAMSIINATTTAEVEMAVIEAMRPNGLVGLKAQTGTLATTHADQASFDVLGTLPAHCWISSLLCRELEEENFVCNSLKIDGHEIVRDGPVTITALRCCLEHIDRIVPYVGRKFASAVKVEGNLTCINASGARYAPLTVQIQSTPCAPESTSPAPGLTSFANVQQVVANQLRLVA